MITNDSLCAWLESLETLNNSNVAFQTSKIMKLWSVIMQAFRSHYIAEGYVEVRFSNNLVTYLFICDIW